MSNRTGSERVEPDGELADAGDLHRPQPDLRALMTRYSRGDANAFKELFALLSNRVYGFHLRSTRSAALAEDLTQQTFLKLHVARRRYRAGAPVEPWLFAIAKNAQRDLHRRQVRSREHLSDEGELPENAETATDPKTRDVFMQERVAVAIGKLPEGQRDVLLLHKFQGLSMQEVSETLGIGISAAKVRAFRAYNALRKLLERDAP